MQDVTNTQVQILEKVGVANSQGITKLTILKKTIFFKQYQILGPNV